MVTVFRKWFKPKSMLRKALDSAYFVFELRGLGDIEGQRNFYHIGILNLTTYCMSVMRLVLDLNELNCSAAEAHDHLALRALFAEVQATCPCIWKKLGVGCSPQAFSDVDLDQCWAMVPYTVALGPQVKDPFVPCEVEVVCAGEPCEFWSSYDGICDDASHEDLDGGSDYNDETDHTSSDNGSIPATDEEAEVNPNDDDDPDLDVPELVDRPRRRQPAWRRRVQRQIDRRTVKKVVRRPAVPSAEKDDMYATDSDMEYPRLGVPEPAAPSLVAGHGQPEHGAHGKDSAAKS